MSHKNPATRVANLVLNLFLLALLAGLSLGPLHGEPSQARQPQPPKAEPTKPTRLTSGQRETRAMDEIVAFLKRIGNQDGANLISDWRTRGKIRSEDTVGGSASYDRIGDYVALDPGALGAVVDYKGSVNMGALFDVAGSLVHEMIHSGQGSVFWGVYEHASWILWAHQAERNAYFGTLSTLAFWIHRLQQEVDDKAGAPPCEGLKSAADLKAACTSFLNYDNEIQQFSRENRPALEAGVAATVKPLQEQLDKRNAELLARPERFVLLPFRGLTDPQRAKLADVLVDMVLKGELTRAEATGGDHLPRERAARKRLAPIFDEIASLESQIAKEKNLLDRPVFDVNSFKWTDQKGNSLSRDQVRADVQARIGNMDEIARRCEESKDPRKPQPILYQGPGAVKLPESLAACLCGCIGTAGAYGAYRPQPVADSPACLEPRYGPCTYGNWGCSRDYFPASGPCFQSCVKAAGLDAGSAIRAISDLKIGNYESALSESTNILNRLPQPSPGISLPRHVRKRAEEGDFQKVAGLVKLATHINPRGKARADQQLVDLSIRALPPAGQALQTMDFETSTVILDALCVAVPTNQEAANRLQQVQRWQQDWAELQRAVPKALALAREGKPCQARTLFDNQVQPRYESLSVPITYANPLGSPLTSSQFLPMPQKEKLVGDARAEISAKSASCEAWAFKQTESLRGYVQAARSFGYQGTPPEDVSRVIQAGERLLADPNMCDCQRVKVEALLRDARASLQKEQASQIQRRPPEPPIGTPSASLKLDKTTFAPGEEIRVRFTASADYARDAWVGIVPSNIPHGSETVNDQHDLVYLYLEKRTSGVLVFKAPQTPGSYDLRMHDTDTNGREVASVSLTAGPGREIAGGGESAGGGPQPTGGGAAAPFLGKWTLESGGQTGKSGEHEARYTGTLVFTEQNGQVRGVFNLQGSETLADVVFSGEEVTFTRQLTGGAQRYHGMLLSPGHIEGVFDHSGTKFRWWATRPDAGEAAPAPPPVSVAKPPVATEKMRITPNMLTASSVYADYTPIKAFDGDLSQNSGWCSRGGQKTGWIIVDFATETEIGWLRLQPDRYIATDPSYGYLSSFRIDAWTNGSWQPVSPMIQTLEERWHRVDIYRRTSKLRVWCESTGNCPQVKEIEIY